MQERIDRMEKEIAELRSLCEALVKDNQRLRESHDAQD
jgi:hypothetical protein